MMRAQRDALTDIRRGAPAPTTAARVRGAALCLTLAALGLFACTETGTDPSMRPDIGGSWSGSYLIGGQSLASTFTFAGMGSEGTGTANIQSLLSGESFEWAFDQAGRVVVLFTAGCEDWLGSLTPAPDATTLEGSLQVSRDRCPVGQTESGFLSLAR